MAEIYLPSRAVLEILRIERPVIWPTAEKWLKPGLAAGTVKSRAKVAMITGYDDKTKARNTWDIRPGDWLELPVRFCLREDVFHYSIGGRFIQCSGLSFERAGFLAFAEVRPDFPEKGFAGTTIDIDSASQAGTKLQAERWAHFAAALAFIANTKGLDSFRSRGGVYKAVSDYLASRGITTMDEKTFRQAIDLARNWVDEGDNPDQWINRD